MGDGKENLTSEFLNLLHVDSADVALEVILQLLSFHVLHYIVREAWRGNEFMRNHYVRMLRQVVEEVELGPTCHLFLEVSVTHDLACVNCICSLAAALFDKTGATLVANQLELLVALVELVHVVVEFEDGSAAHLERTCLIVVSLRHSGAYLAHGRHDDVFARVVHAQIRAGRVPLVELAEARHCAVAIVFPNTEGLLDFGAKMRSPLLKHAQLLLGLVLARPEAQTLTETLVLLYTLDDALGALTIILHSNFTFLVLSVLSVVA